MQRFNCLFLISLFLLTSCNKNDDFNNKIDKEVTFTSTINQNEIGIQELATRWQQGDKIGVFVNGVPKYENTLYTTNGSGFFVSNTPVAFPKGTTSYNFTAYYPYNPSTPDNTITIDLEKNHQNIRYSNNLKNVGRDNIGNLNNLEFKSLLPKIYMLINTPGISTSPVEVQATVTAPAKASLSLFDGKLTVDEHSTTTYPLDVIALGTREVLKGIVMPSLPNSVEVHLTMDGKNYTWKIPNTLAGGYIYVYTVDILENSITISTSISPGIQGDSYTLRPSNMLSPPGEPENPYDPGQPPLRVYMETPVRSSASISPNGYQVTHMVSDISWLSNSSATGEDRNYTVHFDTKERYPVWVAYPLHVSHMTSGNRTDDWQYDPLIPIGYQPDLSAGWRHKDISRGHLLPSASRSASRNLNRTTFYYTNMVAQDSEVNSSTWNVLEDRVRNWSKQISRYDTLYVVTGSILPSPPEIINYTLDVSGRQAAIPKYLYKALCRKNKETGKYYTIGFKMENRSTGRDYIRSVVPVEELEKETGFIFFPHLPAHEAGEAKKQTNLGDWG